MKIGIYSPYLDTAGGGERYILTIAEIASRDNEVDIFLDNNLQKFKKEEIKKLNERRLNLDLSKTNFLNTPFGKKNKFFERSRFLKGYDLVIYLTDGSIFYSKAKKSILHIQSPIPMGGSSLVNKIKLKSWSLIVYNSLFTKENCQESWPLPSKVIYPPVDTSVIKPQKKGKIILTVGRFFGYLKPKKHEVMIDVFKALIDQKKIHDWSFHLAGGVEGDYSYYETLEERSKGYPIFFHPNIPFGSLNKLYGEASIYWHAAGFGEDDPTRMEHFGITTVEAMAGGCVPIVINKGGQKEIVGKNEYGLLWDTIEDLQELSTRIIEDDSLREKLSRKAQSRAQDFSKERFAEQVKKILNA